MFSEQLKQPRPFFCLDSKAKKNEAVRLRFMHRRCASWHNVPLHTPSGVLYAPLLLAFVSETTVKISLLNILFALLVGFTAYGLSIFFYVKAQRFLGAARTSAYYAAAPFAGVLLSMILLHEMPHWSFLFATILMTVGVWLIMKEDHCHTHIHDAVTHNHAHLHDDTHHTHHHDDPVKGWHAHEHTHERCRHCHKHTPDIHHCHSHS